jgi:threonine aldolase
VLCGAAKRTSIRFVTHLDVTRRQVEVAGEVAAQVLSGLSRA